MKILVLPYTHTISHISRPLAVAIELRQRGHDVIFAGESLKTEIIRSEGFPVLSIHEPDPEVLYGNIRQGKLKFVENSEIDRMVSADLELFRNIRPDLVLSDGRFSAPVSTQIENVRHCAIVNVSSTEYRALPYIPLFEWLPNNLGRHLDSVNLSLEMFIFDNVMHYFKELSRKHKLKKQVTATNCLAGNDLTLLADIPEYFPTRNLPADYKYIGPLTWKSHLPTPKWWPPDKKSGIWVYITMGTTGVKDFFPKVYDLLKTSIYCAVMTTGGQCENLAHIDGKIYCEDFVDGDSVMGLCDLVVCHGGNGTIYQALQHGKPIIGMPTIPDQKFNMRRVESLGLGKAYSWEEFLRRPEELLDLFDSVFSDKAFTEKALGIKKLLETYEPAKLAADRIEDF